MSSGQHAEAVAARYLQEHGYKVVQQNWRTTWCEIDIVAQKDGIVSLCEVKYRRSTDQGGGLDYVTPPKLAQMARAAEGWVQAHNWPGDYQLCAIEVSGGDYQVTAFIELWG